MLCCFPPAPLLSTSNILGYKVFLKKLKYSRTGTVIMNLNGRKKKMCFGYLQAS